jgi:hypothetical protein
MGFCYTRLTVKDPDFHYARASSSHCDSIVSSALGNSISVLLKRKSPRNLLSYSHLVRSSFAVKEMTGLSEKANEVAVAYGPALTKAAEGDLTSFQEYVPLSSRNESKSFLMKI